MTDRPVHSIRWDYWTLIDEADHRFRCIAVSVAVSLAVAVWLLTLLQLETKRMPVGTYDGLRYPVKFVGEIGPAPPSEPPPSSSNTAEIGKLSTTPKALQKLLPAPLPVTSEKAGQPVGTRIVQSEAHEIHDQNSNTINTQQPLTSTADSARSMGATATSAGTADNSEGIANGVPHLQIGPPNDHRNIDEIRQVFERNKWPLAVLYDYDLRETPEIGVGHITVKLTVAPNGSVVDCLMISSTFNSPEFEHRIVSQIRLFKFPSENVLQFTFPPYQIEFQPK